MERSLRCILAGLAMLALVAGCVSQRVHIPGYTEATRHQAKGDYMDAIGCYEKFLQKHPDSTLRDVVLYEMGKCHQAQGNLDKAKECYQRTIEEDTEGAWTDLAKEKLAELGAE